MNSVVITRGNLEGRFDDPVLARFDSLMEREDAGTIARGVESLLGNNKLEAVKAFLEICHILNPPKPFRMMMYREFADYLAEKNTAKEKREKLLNLVRREREFLGNGQSAYWLFPLTVIMAEIHDQEGPGKNSIDMLKKYPYKTDFAKIYRFADRETKRIKALDFRSIIPYYVELAKDERSFNDLVFYILNGEQEGRKIGDIFSEAQDAFCNKRISAR